VAPLPQPDFRELPEPSTQPLASPRRRWVPVFVIAAGLLVGLLGTLVISSQSPKVKPIVLDTPPAVESTAPAAAGEDAGLEPAIAMADVEHEPAIDAGGPADSGLAAVASPAELALVADLVAPELDAGVEVATKAAAADASPTPAPTTAAVVTAAPMNGGDPIDKTLEDAKAALAQHRFRGAVALYRKVAKARPPTPAVLTGLGIALVRSESETGYREAIGYLTEGLKDEPRNAQAWLALGIAYQNLGQAEASKGPYQEYLKLRPNGAQSDEIRNALRNSTK